MHTTPSAAQCLGRRPNQAQPITATHIQWQYAAVSATATCPTLASIVPSSLCCLVTLLEAMATQLSLRQWATSLASLVGCVLIFITIIIIIGTLDQKTPTEWIGLSPNAVISILSVSFRGLIVFSISECVGQWKWILFSQSPRRLIEFERIDLASRGPLGSLEVLWRRETP